MLGFPSFNIFLLITLTCLDFPHSILFLHGRIVLCRLVIVRTVFSPYFSHAVLAVAALFQRFWSRLIWGSAGHHNQKAIVSILITPVKRLEREANKSAKRVHFKLRRKTTSQGLCLFAEISL